MPILDVSEYKTYAGITGTEQDDQLALILPWVDDAISTYCDRDFGVAEAIETREYRYDGRGDLEIDDVSEITAVTIGGSTLTENIDYIPGPDRGDVYYWLELPVYTRSFSPEMGFTWNLDVWGSRRPYPTIVSVTGKFGWETVPGPVKLAAALTVGDFSAAFASEGNAGDLQSEGIDSFQRSWAVTPEGQSFQSNASGIPPKALDILDQYRRHTVA